MKRKLLIATCAMIFCFTCSKAFAQEEKKDKYKNAVTFGLIHSMNSTTLHGDFPDDNFANSILETNVINRFAIDLGITVDYYFSQKLSLQLDAIYSSMGGRIVKNSTVYNEIGKFEATESNKLSLNYIKFPVTFNYYPKNIFYLNAGGYAGTLLSKREGDSRWDDEDLNEYDINNFDAGIVAGFGLNTEIVKLGFQYSYGLMDIMEDDDLDIHNGVFQFVVRWKFYSEIR